MIFMRRCTKLAIVYSFTFFWKVKGREEGK